MPTLSFTPGSITWPLAVPFTTDLMMVEMMCACSNTTEPSNGIRSAGILISILGNDISAALGAGAKHPVRRLVGGRENDVGAGIILGKRRLFGLGSILGIVQIGDSQFGLSDSRSGRRAESLPTAG